MSSPAWDPNAKFTIAVDFDGVIHSYTTKWVDAATVPDPPVPGVIEWMNTMLDEFTIVIHTTRAKELEGRVAVRKFLKKHGFKDDEALITAEKPAALLYIDDRGFRFDGDASHLPSVNAIRYKYVPWNKRPMGLIR